MTKNIIGARIPFLISLRKGGWAKMIKHINSFFHIQKYNTSIKTEFIAGLTTYVSSAYILFVNPLILSNTGMDKQSIFLATALAVCFGTMLMGLIANLPIIMAPAMGSNAWFTFTVVLGMGFSWQQALAATFLGGLFFIFFTVTKLRALIINAFSDNIKYAIGTGIGVFVASLGFKMATIIVPSPATIMTLGNPLNIAFLMTILGLAFICILEHYKVKGSLLIAVLVLSIVGLFVGESSFSGLISSPPSLAPTFLQMDFSRIFEIAFISVVLSVFLMDFLDSTGAFMSLMNSMVSNIEDKRIKKALFIDGVATSMGACLGTATNAPYVESGSGIRAGGRTGLTAIFVAILFAISILFSPLLTLVPSWATAPVLIYVGALMFKSVVNIKWDNISESIPAFLIIVIMPLSSSIIHGIGVGILSWIIINVFTKKFNLKKHSVLLLIAIGYVVVLQNM